MLRSFSSGTSKIKGNVRFFMSQNVELQQPKKKSYRMPQEKVIQYFKPSHTIRMHNYKTLIYLNKQRLSTPALLQMKFAIPFFALIYLIKFNPWYLTFPASLPIMMGVEIGVFFSWIFHKRHFKYIVERVYLCQSNYVEFCFSNKIRRRFKGNEASHMFQSPKQLVTPSHGQDGERLWSQKGAEFPQKLQYQMNEKTKQVDFKVPREPFVYGWTKYTNNYVPYIFPKNYEYANWQILVPLLSGRYIDLGDSVNEIHELEPGQEQFSVEQQLKWIQEDAAKNEEEKGKKQASQQNLQN